MKPFRAPRLLLFLLLSFIIPPAFATRVAVVISEKDAIYQKLAEVYLQDLKQKHPDLQALTLSLADTAPEDVRKQILNFYPNVNFSVGKGASDLCAKLLLFPFVYTMVLNPEKAELMDSTGKNRPNCTGIKVLINPKSQFQALKKAVPGSRMIGTLYSSKSADTTLKAKEAATQLGLALEAVEVRNLDEVSQKFREVVKKGVDTFWLHVDTNVLSKDTLEYLIHGCQIREINLLTFNPNHVKDGASIAVYLDYSGLGHQAAEITEQILNGDPIDSIPTTEAKYTKNTLNPKFLFQK